VERMTVTTVGLAKDLNLSGPHRRLDGIAGAGMKGWMRHSAAESTERAAPLWVGEAVGRIGMHWI